MYSNPREKATKVDDTRFPMAQADGTYMHSILEHDLEGWYKLVGKGLNLEHTLNFDMKGRYTQKYDARLNSTIDVRCKLN